MSLEQALGGYREQQADAREQAREKGDPIVGLLLQYDTATETGGGALLADYLEAPDGTFQRTDYSWRVSPVIDGEESSAADDGESFEQQIYAGFIGEPGDGDELSGTMRQLADIHESMAYPAGVEWLAKQTGKIVNQRNTGGLLRGRGTPYGAFGLLAGQDENGDYRLFELDPVGTSDEYSARVAGAPRQDEPSAATDLQDMQETLADRYQDEAADLDVESGVQLVHDLYEEHADKHAPSNTDFEPGSLNITHLGPEGVETQTLDDWLDSFDD